MKFVEILLKKFDKSKRFSFLSTFFLSKEFARCTPQLYAAVIQGTLSVANPTATTKKVAAPTKRSKGASKFVEESSSTNETIPFLTKDEMKREISAMNDELPSEIVDLLTDNLYGSVETFDKNGFCQMTSKNDDIGFFSFSGRKVDFISMYLFNVLKKVLLRKIQLKQRRLMPVQHEKTN